jgi:hypothetical protein
MKYILQEGMGDAGGAGGSTVSGNYVVGSFPTQGSAMHSGDAASFIAEVTQSGKPAQDTQSSPQPQQAPQSPPAQQQQPATPANPMDEFNKLFAPQEAPSQQNPQAPQAPQDAWAVNSDNLRSSSKAVGDALASVIPAEQMQAALQGDTQALGTILSNAVQLAYMASVQNSMQMAKAAVAAQLTQFEQNLPGKFTEFSAQNSIMQDPRAQNPAVKAVLEPMIAAIKTQRPNISAHELSTTVGKFLDTLGATLGTPSQQSQQPAQQQIQQQHQQQPNWAAIFHGGNI